MHLQNNGIYHRQKISVDTNGSQRTDHSGITPSLRIVVFHRAECGGPGPLPPGLLCHWS